MNETMHLFAGAGGGLLADLILGKRPIIAVEWDKYACSVLRERAADGWFPGLSVFEGDIRLFDPSEYAGRVDCIHAGFPCQDISVAGKQAGVGEETRSGLYREVLRIADVVRPRELFLENVSAILNNGLGTVLADLSTIGYSARWICVRASDVGANHGRDRWWLLARRSDIPSCPKHNRNGWGQQFSEGFEEAAGVGYPEHDGRSPKQELRSYEASSNEWRKEEPQQARQFTGADRSIDVSSVCGCKDGSECAKDMADADKKGLQRRLIESCARPSTPYAQPGLHHGNGNGSKSWEAKSSLGGMADEFPAELVSGWWGKEPAVGRVTEVTKDRANQLKGLGNAQVPLQAAVAYSILDNLFNKLN
jgi:DNA (cytosine-5)-methyltransferase 1